MHVDKTDSQGKNYNDWVEILLDTIVIDGRHRIIEHILAPYLINERHLEIEKARKIIESWVEKCEAYEPSRGNINAFIERVCQNTQKFKRKPKDLEWFRKNHKQVSNIISDIVEGYGLEIKR